MKNQFESSGPFKHESSKQDRLDKRMEGISVVPSIDRKNPNSPKSLLGEMVAENGELTRQWQSKLKDLEQDRRNYLNRRIDLQPGASLEDLDRPFIHEREEGSVMAHREMRRLRAEFQQMVEGWAALQKESAPKAEFVALVNKKREQESAVLEKMMNAQAHDESSVDEEAIKAQARKVKALYEMLANITGE